MNYDAVAKDILTLAGGPGNVENLTHCFTRLRLELSDRTKADKEKLAQVEGVVSVVERGGQLQVVIGTKVEYVYEAVCRQMEAGKTPAGKISKGKNKRHRPPIRTSRQAPGRVPLYGTAS